MYQPVDQILDQDAHLAQLQGEVQRLAHATDTIRQHLDPVISAHCNVVRCEGDHVVIMVDSSVWATRIRYLLPQLAALFTRGHNKAPRMSVKVAPLKQSREANPRQALSEESKSTLTRTAEHIGDERLRAVLLRIAARGDSRQE
jgi:hypothetical protein